MATDPTRPPADHDSARNRWLVIQAMRIAGVLMIVAAILVIRDIVDLPRWTAWILFPLGFIEAFITPRVLARMWSTNARAKLEGDDRAP